MNKAKVGRKLHRTRDQRKALLKSLAYNLVRRSRIQTSEAKAKELRPFVEHLITVARKESVISRRYLKTYFDDKTVHQLLYKVAPKYKERPGGYTRITKLAPYRGSKGTRAIIEFV